MRTPEPWPMWGWTGPAQRVLLAAIAVGSGLLLWRTADVEPPRTASPALAVDPNTAPAQVLLALPGLGPARTSAILEARRHAPLRSAGDIDERVRGIGPITVRRITPFLRFPAGPGLDPSPSP